MDRILSIRAVILWFENFIRSAAPMSKPYVILDGGSDFIVGQRYFLRHINVNFELSFLRTRSGRGG